MEPKFYMLIEIIACIIFSFLLVYYYSRRGTNLLALVTAGVTWSLNFILVIFIPYDIYYSYKENAEDESVENILTVGYYIIYWSLFICSWIFVPLMQEYEDSGDFTKKKKFIHSIKSNLIFYGILGIISLILLIISFFIIPYLPKTILEIFGISEEDEDFSRLWIFTFELMNFSYLIGLFLFYFLFGYGIITLPMKNFYKTKYEYQIKYLEWRVIDLKHNLEKIQKELIEDGYKLQKTLQEIKVEKRVSISKHFDEDDEEEKEPQKKEEEVNINQEEEVSPFSSNNLSDYSNVMKERLDYLLENKETFGIKLAKNTVDNTCEPLTSVSELIKLNRKINKNEWDVLRIKIRIRNQYKHWLTLSTILNLENGEDSSHIEITSKNDQEGLIPNDENPNSDNNPKEGLINNDEKPELDGDFIPMKNMSKFKIFYYQKLRKPLLYTYFGILVFGGLLTLVSQFGSIFDYSLYGAILRALIDGNLGIIGLHFFIMIPIIFLFILSIYTFFKLNISGYFYMYKNKQTDSVSLMYFSTNLCRISFSICLDFIFNIDSQFEKNYKPIPTQIQKILSFEVNKEKTYFKLYRFLPSILVLYVIILLFKIPQRIAKCCGKNIFSVESEESMEDINEGHDYYMEFNQKYKGEMIPKEKLILPEDKYNK